jgi:hypothetical protein
MMAKKKAEVGELVRSRYEVDVELTTPMLGTVPYNKEVYASFVATKAAELGLVEEEVGTVEDREQRGWTGFHRFEEGELKGQPFIYDYVVKGFFKEAARCMNRVKGSYTGSIFAFIKVIDGNCFVFPRRLPLVLPAGVDGLKLPVLERPLRCQTAQGERVTVTRADVVPEGTRFSFRLDVLGADPCEELLREWLDYGVYRAFGQWRNGSYGRMTYKLRQVEWV